MQAETMDRPGIINGVEYIVAGQPIIDDSIGITVSPVAPALTRRDFLRLSALGVGVLFLSPWLQACAAPPSEPAPPYPFAKPEELTVGISLTAKDGRTANFNERAWGIPREKIVTVRKNLEVVNLSQTAPILIQSTLEQVARETALDNIPASVRLYYIDTDLPVAINPGHDIAVSYFDKKANRITSWVSLKRIVEVVDKDRKARGEDIRRLDPARVAADIIYRLSENTAHELYHDGYHIPLGDAAVLANYDRFEQEARRYSQAFLDKVQFKQIAPLTLITKFPTNLIR